MIKYVYGWKNKKSGNFQNPIFYDIPEEAAQEAFAVSVLEVPEASKEMVKELDCFYLGTFDTKSGEFKSSEPVFILSAESVLTSNGGQKEAE